MGMDGALDTGSREQQRLALAIQISDELSRFESDGIQPPAVTAAFRRRGRTAAGAALAIARIIVERSRVGFLPLSLSHYLEELSKSAQVELRPLLAASGIEGEGGEPWPLPAVARLCRRLGLTFREAFLHLGIGQAESIGARPVSMVMARRRTASGGSDPLAAYEAALREAVAEIDATEKLQAWEADLRSAYEESGNGE